MSNTTGATRGARNAFSLRLTLTYSTIFNIFGLLNRLFSVFYFEDYYLFDILILCHCMSVLRFSFFFSIFPKHDAVNSNLKFSFQHRTYEVFQFVL